MPELDHIDVATLESIELKGKQKINAWIQFVADFSEKWFQNFLAIYEHGESDAPFPGFNGKTLRETVLPSIDRIDFSLIDPEIVAKIKKLVAEIAIINPKNADSNTVLTLIQSLKELKV